MEASEGNASPMVEVPNGSKCDGKTEVDNGEMENGSKGSSYHLFRYKISHDFDL